MPELRRAISVPRLQRYENLAGGNSALAMQLYHWNSALSEALHGPLLSLEVTLRNAVNDRLCADFGETWYDNPKSPLRQSQSRQIQDAKTHLADVHRTANASNIIGALSLGFWVGLFAPKYEISLWRGHL